MRKPRGTYAGTDRRRSRIIRAALECFSEQGFVDTTMADIRRRSRASNGSIYHHFRSKEELAAAVYLEGILDYQQGLVALLPGARSARAGIFAMVRYHLGWVDKNRLWAGYLTRMRHADFMLKTESSISEANSRFVAALAGFFKKFIASGQLRALPPEIYISLILGPSQEFVRYWLNRPGTAALEQAAMEFGRAAWQAVKK